VANRLGLRAGPTSGDAKLCELRGDILAVVRRTDLLVDVENAAVGSNIESPARGERLILVHDTVGLRDFLRRVAQQREVDPERLRKRFVDIRRIDADREIRDIEYPDVVATLTE
jgi:hypothetical protein